MGHQRGGIWAGVAAYTIWGVAPAFWKLIDDVPALEQMAHRVIWAPPLLLIALALRGRLAILREELLRPGALRLMVIAAVVLSCNWLTFIWAVITDRVLDVSLGYFINPLLLVALGVLVLRERLTRAQTVAIGLAVAGVAYMAVRVGSLPWISLVLAGTFGMYGLLKKQGRAAPAVEAVFGETGLMAVPGLMFVVVLAVRGESTFGSDPGTSLLLIGAGAVTAAPLLLFGTAAQRIPLTTVGILQYLAPSIQFLLGVLAFGERVTRDQMIGFILVWLALALYTADNLRAARAAGRAQSPAEV